MPRCSLKWLAAALALPALAALLLLAAAAFGLNWARGPLQDLSMQKTGRALRIAGDLDLVLGWPSPRLRAQAVSFANPAWAEAPQMLVAETVEFTVDLRELLRGRLAFPELKLTRPQLHLAQASGGRKTWLLDPTQTDEQRRIPIGRLLLDQGEVSYSDPDRHTALQARLSTRDTPAAGPGTVATTASLVFSATGQFRGQPLVAEGSGGPVLAWRDETHPYPLRVVATVGRTAVQAAGTVTSLLKLTAVDLQLALHGDNLASLFPLIGIALPPTPAYRTAGRLVRSGSLWRYESFTGAVGRSDLSGTLQVDTARGRPMLSGALDSRRLDLADLRPAIGARPKPNTGAAGGPAQVAPPPGPARVLPDLPIDTAHWDSLDADVTLQAQSLQRAKALPLDNLQLRLRLNDARLTLDPLNFGVAGGQLKAQVTLDGRAQPLRGRAKLQLRGLMLARLMPTADLRRASIGRLDGDAELSGAGPSLGRMLASADGRLSLVTQNGEISRLLMEQVGLHLLEILQLQLTGDKPVQLRCAVADFGLSHGVMQVRALVLDTAVNTLIGSGRIDLAQETLNLKIEPHTKVSSLVALRSPFYIKGSFAHPVAELDTARIATRGVGALALGLLNPLLALIPLFEAGPGVDSECARLVRETHMVVPGAKP